MANVLAPSGFHPIARADGAAPNYRIHQMKIAYNNAHSIGYGDPIKLLNTGYIDIISPGDTTISGIFLGCNYYNPSAPQNQFYPSWTAPSLASTTVVVAMVLNDPMIVMQCQVDGSVSGALVQSAIGQNIDITSTAGAPNSLSGISTCALDGNNLHTTATLPFKVFSIVQAPAINSLYDGTATNQWLNVTFNTNALVQTLGI